jgi:uncharacterized protein YjbI with pentapeptide repeats
MANPEHLEKLQKGVSAWNAWRQRYVFTRPDLRGADLRREDLRRADLRRVRLSNAMLNDVNLNDADLRGADVSGAKLSGASLSGANLSGANIGGANFRRAKMFHTILASRDLRSVTGLKSVIHYGPSFVDIDTIYKSNGKIPEDFLRGAGVPERFIEYMKSFVGVVLDYSSCFISYSTKDQEFADRLYADLQNKGVRCWFAPHDIQGGKKVHEQIDAAIRIYDKLLLILSNASMASEWVKSEIAYARQKEKEQARRVLFPITLVNFSRIKKWKSFDADIGKDSAREIREYYIPDFSRWRFDHASYKKELDRLLRDLKAENQRA